ncbi:glycosyltransferase [Nostoc sp. FACHB-152]|uniref:glycosyltransferase family 4 protein n=1 Tax=unclassified Nostoc TaxID=2593658 RepID=UPI0016844D36|nr:MULTISPECIES: glycosyltransferase [unclassified Nostoc]MBD2445784.1 glycosyltransferase [Nostoc sp. FACHB-152]MBD2466898.1 glycosyltransferase [Nostoc sp. FACHB-145]
MKVLLSTYSCEPGKGSERGVGWNVACEVAKHHKVWVLTRPDESREAIEAELAKNPISNLHFVYFTLPFWKDSLRWGQSGAMQIHYYLWQIQAYFVAKQLHREIGFDIAHHVTFVKYSSPSFLTLLPIPFIWGAVGGGETTPPAFWKDFSLKNRIYETLRLLARGIGEVDPFTRMTARRSTIAFAATEDTALRVQAMGAPHVKISSAIALSQQEIDQLAHCPTPSTSPVRFISIARLLHWKGFHLGLRAFAQANLQDAEYWVVGDGSEAQRLASLAKELNIAHQVKFWGLLERDQVLSKLGQSSVLVHPSLHDSGAGVCLEAMAAGRPIICLDLGGPAQQVTEETGFKIPAHSPEQAIATMAQAMVQLAQNQDLRVQMGKAGQQRVQQYYSWAAKGEELSYIYQSITNKTAH